MKNLAMNYPRYAFEVHKGYGTALHLQSLMLYGASDVHRKSFLKKIRGETISPDSQGELF